MSNQEILFDPSPYTSREISILKILGHPNDDDLNVNEYYRMCPFNEIMDYYTLTLDGNGDAQSGSRDPFYENNWVKTPINDQPLEGFLRGFPTVRTKDKTFIGMHLHALWDDINASSMLIPLEEVDEIYKYPDLYAELLSHEHELYAGLFNNSQEYEVPLLRNKKTGEFITRQANAGDLEATRNALNLKPVQLIGPGMFSDNKHKPKGWISL